MGLIGGDPEHLAHAAAALKPVTESISAQAVVINSAGDQAAAAADQTVVSSAITQLAHAFARAADDTGVIIGHLGEVAEISSSNLRQAGGT